MASLSGRKPLRSPFVVTVSALSVPAAAAVAVAVGGCSGSLVTYNPPPPDAGVDECPATAPASGSPCSLSSTAVCNYGPCSALRCGDTKTWQSAVACNPPPLPQCPAKAPQLGTTCAPASIPAAGCTFPADENLCSGNASNFTCDTATSTWTSPSKPACPALPAAVGSPCGGLCPTTFDAACIYPAAGPSSCEIDRICDNGKWMDSSPTCNPPPPPRDAGTD